MPYELFSWMVERFDHRSKCFKVHSRDVRVTEKYGETIIGLKKGKIKISSILKKGEVDESFEQELGVIVSEKIIQLFDLKNSC